MKKVCFNIYLFVCFSNTELKFSPNNKMSGHDNGDLSSCQVNPESIYGSYIEDSYTGDLVGDYHNDESEYQDNQDQEQWAINENMNNEIEFDFDSFGPESIIYTGNTNESTPKDKNKKPNEQGIFNILSIIFINF